MTSVSCPARLVLVLSLPVLSVPALAAQQQEDEFRYCETLTFQIENDDVGGSDRHYTSGNRLACAGSMPGIIKRQLQPLVPDGMEGRFGSRYGLGYNFYTPDDISEPDLIEDDQPYAGWLYLDFGFDTEVRSASGDIRYLDNLSLQVGVVGPLAGGEEVQTFSHDVLNATEPEGWDNQLDNEPGINYFYDRQWTGLWRQPLTVEAEPSSLAIDMTPKLGAALGNIYTHAATGMTFRLGRFETDDHGPPAIRPSFTGSDRFPRTGGFSTYLFGGVEGRVVARNIFLDGNSFDSDSPSVDKKTLVGEARFGMAMTYGDVHLSYTHVLRSREFDGQEPQTFGGLTLSIGL